MLDTEEMMMTTNLTPREGRDNRRRGIKATLDKDDMMGEEWGEGEGDVAIQRIILEPSQGSGSDIGETSRSEVMMFMIELCN
jgi:hypothetical protein